MKYVIAALAAVAAALPAEAATLVDDFNRPDSTNLGPDYTDQNSGLRIVGNRVQANSLVALATYNGSSSTDASVDVALRGLDAGSYVALALGYLSGQGYFIKVQDNDADGFFDSYGFFEGNNGFISGLRGLNPFQSGTMSVSYAGTVATLLVEAGGSSQTFSYDYGYAPGSLDVGLGINRLGVADNLGFDFTPVAAPVPEPASWAMLIAGFGLTGTALRTSRRPRAHGAPRFRQPESA